MMIKAGLVSVIDWDGKTLCLPRGLESMRSHGVDTGTVRHTRQPTN